MRTLNTSITTFAPAVALSKLVSRRLLSWLRIISFAGMTLFAGTALYSYFLNSGAYLELFVGLSAISAAGWIKQILLFGYHNSLYYRGLNSVIGMDDVDISGATYEVAEATLPYQHDITKAFCVSPLGSLVLLRSGITGDVVDMFLSGSRQTIGADVVVLPENEIFSLIGLGKYLLTHDSSFRNLLTSSGATEETFMGALRWVIGDHHQSKRLERWWSKDNLSRHVAIGRDWTFGVPYTLEKFSRPIKTGAVFANLSGDTTYAAEKVLEIETALARTQGANVMIIGEEGVGKTDLIMLVEERMCLGQSLSAVSGKHIFVLDTDRLFATAATKQQLENTLINLLEEAVHAGNSIIVIEHISTVLSEAQAVGVFLPELLDRYLAFPYIQFIVTDTPGAYHTKLETLGTFSRRFVEVLVEGADLSATTRLLETVAKGQEATHGIIFTYAGLHAVTLCADRYIAEGVMPDKAIDLLMTVATAAPGRGTVIISNDFVYGLVGEITGVPVGPIKNKERDLLLHLEDHLHQRVIGQKPAISAIARTMRRARAGIQTTDKPIGSFLFLGPTGVGKTETAKALAYTFFGNEQALERLDMSEYSGADALARLIGDDATPGTLSNLVHEHPYCVLLLDEFEKANQTVHDLFLQILDEGVFTDGRGSRINMRNCIIIATSNAGSDLIRKTVEQRKNLATLEQAIIDHVIESGSYRPELINRFDDTVIFEPLTMGQQTEVARLLLGDLYERIKERGYTLVVQEDLLSQLIEKGYSPEFGARPMRRILQDVIEEKVAQKIISGQVTKGSSITLGLSEFNSEELAVL